MKNKRLLILFDLDGTLVNPEGAITGGIAAALRSVGLTVPGAEDMRRMVGPALVRSLVDIAGVPEDRVAEVIAVYRAGYRAQGMAESSPYPGIVPAVRKLRELGHYVAVATQKPERLARELLEIQGMTPLFDSIHGSPNDEQAAALLDGKRAIIAAALAEYEGNFDQALMIGDRLHDIEGAAANGLECVAVQWGFGSLEEFTQAGAAAVVRSSEELLDWVLAYAQPLQLEPTAQVGSHGRL